MSRPVKITKEDKKNMMSEFMKKVDSIKITDKEVVYKKNLDKGEKSEKATILLTPSAYCKIVQLIDEFDTEVAWHGIGKRIDKSTYSIEDILVYPQYVTGVTVDMEPEEYTKWIIENAEDERFDNIIMQGHSHVHFSTVPSGTDLSHQEEILSMLSGDKFYIFTIWNKNLENTTRIFDFKTNTVYENNDIAYKLVDENLKSYFIDEAKKLVRKKTPEVKTVKSDSFWDVIKAEHSIYTDSNETVRDRTEKRRRKK